MTGFPFVLHARIISFCIPGTLSGGSSTPKSPLATIIASEARIISFNSFKAEGFSILEIIAALLLTIFFTFKTSDNF